MSDQDELIHHFKNLFGYTREAVQKAIVEIREDCKGEEPTDLQRMLLERADDMERSLAAIEEQVG